MAGLKSSRRRRRIAQACAHSTIPELLETRTLFSVPEPNDNFAQAYMPSDTEQYYLTANFQASDQVTAGTDADYFHFYSFYGKSQLNARLSGQTSDCDLEFYGSGGTPLATYSVNANIDTSLYIQLPGNQDIYAAVKSHSGTTNYTLQLYPDYAGNNPATARDNGISLGQTYDHTGRVDEPELSWHDYLDARDNEDYVKFRMEAPGTVGIHMNDVDNVGGLQARVMLYDESLNLLADTGVHVAGAGLLNLDHVALDAGTYYARFSEASGYDAYTYQIVSDYAGDTPATARDLGDVTNSSRGLIDMVGNQPGGGGHDDDAIDFYKFTLNKQSPLNIRLNVYDKFIAPRYDANLILARDDNNDGQLQLTEILATGTNPGDDSVSSTGFAPGTYFVIVKQNGDYTPYQLNIDSDFDYVDANAYASWAKATNAGTQVGLSYFHGGFGVSDDRDSVDFYKFTMSAPGRFTANAYVNAYFSRNLSQPELIICRDANNNGVFDSGENLLPPAEGAVATQLSAGTYFLVVGESGPGQQSYDLRIMSDYAGDTLGKARPFAAVSGNTPPTQTFNDYIEQKFTDASDFNDFYSFTLPSTYSVTLKTTGVAGQDLQLWLIQDKNNNGLIDEGEVVAHSDNLDSPAEQISTPLSTGKYFVRVSGVNGATIYQLSASFAGDVDNTINKVDARPNNIKTLGTFADGSTNPSSDVDLYRFTAAAGQRVSFDLDSRNASNLDTVLRLFKADGTQLAINNDGKAPGETAGKFSYLEYVFPTAGNYYIGVSLNGNAKYDAKTGANNIPGVGTTGDYRLYINNLGPATAPAVLRVNAGGSSFTDANGNFFVADTGFTGGTKSTTTFAVANTNDDSLFATNRIGSSFSFSQAVANGTYQLTLNFAEPTAAAAGQRKFNVFAEGTQILANFDLVAAAVGATKTAISKTFNVTVNDGKIDLSFAGLVGNALVSSISLVKQ
jgi:hypothetical protein